MNKKVHDIFGESMVGVFTIMVFSIFMFIRAYKDKSAFKQITGTITTIGKTNTGYFNHDPLKFRYLGIENYQFPFELFVGKDPGDFKPEFEQVDKLHPGDIITVYYNEKPDDDQVNRLTGFIDRGNEPIFIRGSWEKGFAFFIAGFDIALLALLLLLKKKGKIA